MAVTMEKACGGIILTASHNPKQWNALKLLNERGEFLNAEEGNEVLELAASEDFTFAEVDSLGKVTVDTTYKQKHIESVLNLELVDVEAIKAAYFRVAIDCVSFCWWCRFTRFALCSWCKRNFQTTLCPSWKLRS